MNGGRVEQIGSPQDVWEHPATPFVYGFLGDVNLFHGRAHEGRLHLGAVELDAHEHAAAQDPNALAYVRPHDLDVHRYAVGTTGIVARLQRAIVVGPVARLELLPVESLYPAGGDPLIEAQIPADRFRELGVRDGDLLVVSPRKARVFLEPRAA